MKAVEFKEQNVVYAKDQPQYLPLPAHKTADGTVLSCWKLNRKERRRIAKGGKLWLGVMTSNQPLQPLFLSADSPFVGE